MDNLHLTPVINIQRITREGKCQIRIRSTVKRKVRYWPTGISVLPEQFNGEIIAHPNKTLLNALLRQQLNEIERKYLEGMLGIKPPDITDFYPYCEEKIKESKGLTSHDTWKHKVSQLRKLQAFRPRLRFEDIDNSFMQEYEKYCMSLGNMNTTVWSSIKFIKVMINTAIKEKAISVDPLASYTRKPYAHPKREHLTDDELEKIEAFAAKCEIEKLRNVAYWFLFGCYSGLRYSDVASFDKKSIVGDRIILRTSKSRVDVSIKIHSRLKLILDKMSTSVYSNQKMNDYLKIVGEKCDIKKDIKFHLSRHTFAVYFLNHGGTIETLQALMGHNSLKTTAIYAKITNIRIDAEIEKVWA